ncbi:aminotransferase [Coprinopsis cinerea okayama7|uniref:Aminotransferase n=1 Tax=Coprinopsis cinerea (strain Okayama-7 / 130 / ATCC MYA-4618 / FGSC 9003) TaxID=240176 RepID=A8NVN8_COPC7|nr:aminotransferase [Coprinopsis cinerea okayama7\|eukprot:XP_001836693.2 aminotransferase [Coprinopsis cinerea okayama7\
MHRARAVLSLRPAAVKRAALVQARQLHRHSECQAQRNGHHGTSVIQPSSTSRAMSTTSERHEHITDLGELYEFGLRHVTHGLGRITTGIMTKGDGSYVEYADGRRLLDFTCGIGVTNLGHAHPRISGAAADQCMKLVHSQCSISLHEPYLRLIERLLPVMPHPSLDSFFFWNSGSEAVEAAIKMARTLTGRQNIICMQGAYHGRTMGAMAVTKSKTIYSQGVHPVMPGVYSIPYPYWHQVGVPVETPTHDLATLALTQLDLVLAQQSAPSDTAAIIIEPVLGEGGYVPAPVEFLQGLREVCDKHGILLIIDEVQSGFGRTGTYFAIEESGVRPDILVMAKGLGNGFPISGVGGTYAGNAVACAAAVAVQDVIQEECVLENVQARSRELFSVLRGLLYDPSIRPHILDIRGRGLMVGVEFASPTGIGVGAQFAVDNFPTTSTVNTLTLGPSPYILHDSEKKGENGGAETHPRAMASRVAKKCIEKGMLILTTSVFEVIRFIPPLNISKEDLAKGCQIFAEAVKEVVEEG